MPTNPGENHCLALPLGVGGNAELDCFPVRCSRRPFCRAGSQRAGSGFRPATAGRSVHRAARW